MTATNKFYTRETQDEERILLPTASQQDSVVSWTPYVRSELVAQGRLNLPRSVYDSGSTCKVAIPRNAEVAIENVTVHLTEDMPVESIGNVQLEQDRM